MQTFSWCHLFASFLIFYPQHSADVIWNVKQDKRSKSRSLVFGWLLCHYHCFLFIGTWKPFTFCKIKSKLHLNIVKMVCFLPNLVPHFFFTYVYSYFKSILNVLTDWKTLQQVTKKELNWKSILICLAQHFFYVGKCCSVFGTVLFGVEVRAVPVGGN